MIYGSFSCSGSSSRTTLSWPPSGPSQLSNYWQANLAQPEIKNVFGGGGGEGSKRSGGEGIKVRGYDRGF